MRVSRAIAGLGRVYSSAILALATIVVLLTACDGSFLEPGPVGEIVEVRVSLESHTFTALEETLTVEAEVLDGSGTSAPDVTLEWQSSDPSIVSVDSMGTATAKAAGAALVIVGVAAAADTVFFTVDPEEGAQHQPTADGVWFSDDFESGNASHSQNGFRWNNPDWDVTTEHSFSGSYALRFHYPGEPRGQMHTSELRFTIAESAEFAPSEVWIEYMFRVPDNFVHRNEWKRFGKDEVTLLNGGVPFTGSIEAGSDVLTLTDGTFPDFLHKGDQAVLRWRAYVGDETDIADRPIIERISDTQVRMESPASVSATDVDVSFRVLSGLNNKFFLLWGKSYDAGTPGVDASPRWTVEFQHQNTSLGDVHKAWPRMTPTSGLEAGSPNATTIRHADIFREEDRGNWIRLRYHAKIDDEAGTRTIWRDDTLVAEIAPNTRTSWGDGHDYWLNGYLMGWANTGYSEDTTFYIDDFTVYTSDPDW